MTRRKGEISRADIMRKWPHHVALAAEKVGGIKNDEAVRGFADTLSVAPRPHHVRRDDNDFVVFCFGKPEDAQALRRALRRRALADAVAMTAPLEPQRELE